MLHRVPAGDTSELARLQLCHRAGIPAARAPPLGPLGAALRRTSGSESSGGDGARVRQAFAETRSTAALRAATGSPSTLAISGGVALMRRRSGDRGAARSCRSTPTTAGTRRWRAPGESVPRRRAALRRPRDRRGFARSRIRRDLGALESVAHRRYVGEAEATAATFHNHLDSEGEARWRTGDLGALVEGHLFVTGRRRAHHRAQPQHVPADVRGRGARSASGPCGQAGSRQWASRPTANLPRCSSMRSDRRAVPNELVEAVRRLARPGLHLARLVVLPKGRAAEDDERRLQRRQTAARLATNFDALLDRRWTAPPPAGPAKDALVATTATLPARAPPRRGARSPAGRSPGARRAGIDAPASGDISSTRSGSTRSGSRRSSSQVERGTGRALAGRARQSRRSDALPRLDHRAAPRA
ncbi:MAG: hypothetical protein H6701_13915 [Myxococcales bacterium]|nr:hypothetical protein [Myxococcales bacterium]